MTDSQLLIDRLTRNERKRWRRAKRPRELERICLAVWPLADREHLDEIIADRLRVVTKRQPKPEPPKFNTSVMPARPQRRMIWSRNAAAIVMAALTAKAVIK